MSDTPEMIVVDIPPEFADAGFLASVKTEDGKLDVNKALNKMKNQESALGKRALPTKDSSDSEINEFLEKMRTNTADVEYDTGDAKALKTALKAAGLLPKQADAIIAAYKTDLQGQYDEDAFKTLVNESLSKEDLEIAKKQLTQEEWDELFATRNKEAVGRLRLAAVLGKRYGAEEKGIGAGTPTGGMPATKKGMCPEYLNEMKTARSRNASQAELDAIMTKYGWNHATSSWDD